ncbi:fatty acyl-AMP ligase [Acetobacter sacchari]|uniref:Fatty acyl-AMP ligase n=1 Tax=Acetobacter sacchari TaxID=2661687 RepID=A0ABS3M164_9PROT|nr:fatty acyl-AMP ligase [Acetobacter sacchari]MBO1361879.1 fatty acyl-AMP ligase [Acetobacter sacchari]
MKQAFQTVTSAQGEEILDWRSNTIIDALFYYAHVSPDLQLYTLLGDGENETDSATAEQLAVGSRAMAGWLRRLLPCGARVILLYDNSLDYVRGLLGCLSAGLTPVSGVYPKAFGARDRFLAIRDDCQAKAVIGNRSVLAEFQPVCPDISGRDPLLWIPTDKIRSSEDLCVVPSHDDLALIQYTSGSTRTPRGVMLSHRNIAHNLFRQAETFGYRRGDCGVNWLPLSHDMGLIGGALMTLAAGGRCVLLAPEHVVESPIRWLRAISRYRATLSGGPNFAYGMCARLSSSSEFHDLDLSSWEVAFNGAEYIHPETVKNFSSRFSRYGFKANAFFACYGLAEATLLVTATNRGKGIDFRSFSRTELAAGQAKEPVDAHDARLLVSCGVAPTDIHVCIAEENTEAVLPDGSIGEIRVSGPGVGLGYVNRPLENKTVFEAHVPGTKTPYLRTGDNGFILDGALYVIGRQDGRIIIDGKAYEPEDVVACLEPIQKDIRLFSTVVFVETVDDQPYLVVATEPTTASLLESDVLGRAIGEVLCAIYPVKGCRCIFLKVGAVLKTPSGKVRTTETRDALLRGSISEISQYLYRVSGSAKVRILRISKDKI